MFHSRVLDVAVGLFLVYCLLSLVCTVLNEWIVALTRLRSRSLRTAVLRLLDDASTGLGTAFYKHAAIACLRCPEFLEPRLFADVLADLLAGPQAVRALPPCGLRRLLIFLLADVSSEKVRAVLGRWFEDAMAPVTATYRRRLHAISALVALFICVSLDADTARMAHFLWTSAADRDAPWSSPGPIAGWALSAIAVSRGAPFWFDLLDRVKRLKLQG